jgi:hypothetical protein
MEEHDTELPASDLLSNNHADALDQSADTEAIEQFRSDENVSDVTISLRSAEQKIAAYDRAEADCGKKLKYATYNAIVAIYALILSILQSGGLKAFYRAHAIEPHGNTKNPFQPLIAHLFRHYDRGYTRQTIWRWSAVIYVACSTRVSLHAMLDFLIQFGLDRLADDYKSLRNGEKPTHKLSDQELADSISLTKTENNALPHLPVTAELDGKYLAVLDCNSDRGEAHIIAILRPGETHILKIMAADARRRLAAGK